MRARAALHLPLAAALSLAACADGTPTAPRSEAVASPTLSTARADHQAALAELRRVTARYHDVNAAIADGFVPVTAECEEEAGGPVMPIPYAHFGRILDGRLDASLPDALLYEPDRHGRLRLVGVEVAMLLSASAEPPTFLGVPLQREEELGVYGLHVWVWRDNPLGMFAEGNPRVTCGAD